MRFTPQFLDELKARLPVSEVVGKRVRLTRSGREFKGLSPFNKEKTASFFVNDQKQAWFDFSSGKNGSIFDFVMESEGVTFPEAVERLAQMAGVPLPVVSAQDEQRDARRKTLHDVMELAAKFFQDTLASRAGAKARGYLADRGLDPATQVKFRLGYATNERFALKEHLGSHGIPVEDIHVGVIRDASRERQGVYKLTTRIAVGGPLTDAQREKLIAVAAKCPVHKLMSEVVTEIETVAVPYVGDAERP